MRPCQGFSKLEKPKINVLIIIYRVFIMKLNSKKLIILLTAIFFSATQTKNIEQCITSAICAKTLQKNFETHHPKIALVFKDGEIKTEDDVKKAIQKLPSSEKIAIAVACKKHEKHLRDIITK